MDDKDFELPKVNNEEENTTPEEKPLIEIPQEYYDKLEKEKKEKEAQAEIQAKKEEENQISTATTNKIFIGAFVNAIIFIVLLYLMINKNKLFIVGLPIYIIVYSYIKVGMEEKESTAPMSTLMGGFIAAGLCFICSLVLRDDLKEFFSYGVLASIAVAFIGVIISSMLTNMIANKEETKAVGTLGYLIFFVLLFAGPYFAYKKFPEPILKYVFNEKNAIVAESEEEYMVKTLKNRYGVDFDCSGETTKALDEDNTLFTQKTCTDKSGTEVIVLSTEYSSSRKEYIVKDNYVEAKLLSQLKSDLADEIKIVTNANSVSVLLYPKEYCAFVGDCVENSQYIKNYEKETNRENQFSYSKNLDLKKYINMKPIEFANSYGLGYSITIYGSYSSLIDSKHQDTINKVLDTLNTSGYKNNNGYIIKLKQDDELKQVVYQVEGKASSDGQFKDPVIK